MGQLRAIASGARLRRNGQVARTEGAAFTNVAYVSAELDAARRGEGQTLFDVLLEIIRVHGAGGEEQEDGVELELR